MSRRYLRAVFFLLLATFLVVAAIQYGTVLLEAWTFDDFVEQQVKFAQRSRHSLEDVRAAVVNRSDELGIGLLPRDVQIDISKKSPTFTLSLSYTQPVDMFFFQHTLQFKVSKTGPIFVR
jgi:hypothetical protein